ncbi:MAG: fibronectin type III domain-containing protein [Methanomassiliicoccales archaeon]|nr:fibronectin type III domain-containing protein [Methanomassiliicoccales archaeon]
MLRAVAGTFIAILFLSMMAPAAVADVAGAPMDFSAERDGSRIFLSWGPPENVTVLLYNVYRGTDRGNMTLYDTVDANFTAGYDTEVVTGWTYYYAVSANTTDGEGTLSEVAEVPPASTDSSALIMTVILTAVVVTLLFAYWKGRGSG